MVYLHFLKFITPKNLAITALILVFGFLITKVYLLTLQNNELILDLKDKVIEIDTLKNNTKTLENALDLQNEKFKNLQIETNNKIEEYNDWKNNPEKYKSIKYITRVKEVNVCKTMEKKLDLIKNLNYKDI